MLVSRSTEEAHLYMHLHPCECGEADFEWRERRVVQGEERLLTVYSGECEACGLPRAFEFALVPEPSPPPPALGGDAPSHIIDPGEFLQTSRLFAAAVPDDPDKLDADQFYRAYDALAFALASLDEVVKFIPAGGEAVPADAFHTSHGRQLYEDSPELFTRDGLEASRDGYRQLLARYADAAGHPVAG